MKRITTLIVFLGVIVFSNAQQRQQVTRDEAINAALTKLTGTNNRTESFFQTSERHDSLGNTLLYEVTLDSVSLLLSGSKACRPILAKYTVHNGPLLNRHDNIPDGMRVFIDYYLCQIESCFNNDTVRLYYESQWDSLVEGINLVPRNRVSIGPLISSKWSQRGCNNNSTIVGYEYHTPSIPNNCEHALVGCVAVAMGQVMNYWKHPVSMGWIPGFDWCNMSNALYSNSPTLLINREAISTLLYDCGENVHMQYGCNGSGARFDSVKSALVNVYGYSTDAEYVAKGTMSDHDWASILRQQIDIGRPVLYEASDRYGLHTFICDGYGDDDCFGFNWGAGGEGNGSFSISDISPLYNDLQHQYSLNQKILKNIHPAYRLELCSRDVQLEEYYIMCEPFIQQGLLNPWEIIPVTVTKLTSASESSPSLWRTIPSGYSSKYQAQRSVTLKHGFTVERGADFVARIEPCAFCESNNREETMVENPMDSAPNGITDEEYSYPSINAAFDLGIDTLTVYSSKEFFSLTPNPTDGKVSVEVNSDKLKDKSGEMVITVCDATGREVLKQKASTLNSQLSTLNLEALPAGTYFVTVTIGGQSGTRKLVVK